MFVFFVWVFLIDGIACYTCLAVSAGLKIGRQQCLKKKCSLCHVREYAIYNYVRGLHI